MNVWIVFVLFACWVIADVVELMIEVLGVSDAVLVISAMPYLAGRLLAHRERIASLDVLNALCCGLIEGWRNEDMNVIGHDDEAVELESLLLAMLEESFDEEFGIGCALEVAVLLECRDRDGVGALRLADGGHV